MGRPVILTILLLAPFSALPPPAAAFHAEPDGANDYVQPTRSVWPVTAIDVFLMPPVAGQILNYNGILNGMDSRELSPCESSYTHAMQDALGDWKRAIQAFAPDWFRNGFELNVVTVGCDPPAVPDATYLRGRILITHGAILPGALGWTSGWYGPPCVVNLQKIFGVSTISGRVAPYSLGYEDFHHVTSHEVGHCLGLWHNNEYDSEGLHQPGLEHDVMDASGYSVHHASGDAPNHKHCLSNLNIAGTVAAFKEAFGIDDPWNYEYHPWVPKAEYEILDC